MKRLALIFLMLISLPLTPVDSASHHPDRLLIELHTSSVDFATELERRFPTVQILETFETLFNGIAIEGRPDQLDRITEFDAVKQAYPISTYHVAPENLQHTNTINLLKDTNKNEHQYTGKGVKVGVIDTGIDYTHPDLQVNFKGGYDLVDFDDDPMETVPEQGLPTLHGTHVAGIIAANGVYQGIAPDAEIYGYRALGPGGSGTSVQVIAALEKAVDDGMDIINLSLGNQVNGPDYPTSIAVNRAIDHGVTIVIATGNSGPADWTVGSPATATAAISVGASTRAYEEPILIEPKDNKELSITPIAKTGVWDLDRDYSLIFGGLGLEPLPDATGQIVLFKRGEITFADKIAQAKQANARAVLIYNDSEQPIEAGVDEEVTMPAALLSLEDGEWLLSQLHARQNIWLDTSYQVHENKIAPFSSRGPVTANWEIKPEIVAPGVDIVSTVPGGHASLQGTSMAAPYVSGVLAVLKEAHPEWSPAQLKSAILTQAEYLPDQKPIEQGMGQVDLSATLTTPVVIENPIINFGFMEGKIEKRTHQLKFTNLSNQRLSIQFIRPTIETGFNWNVPTTKYLDPNETLETDLSLTIKPNQIGSGIHQDYLSLLINSETYHLPYLFINQTADFPEITGFEIEPSRQNDSIYHMQLQIAEPSDQVTVELYDPSNFSYLGQLFKQEAIDAGRLEIEVDFSNIDPRDFYLINVSIKKDQETNDFQQIFQQTVE